MRKFLSVIFFLPLLSMAQTVRNPITLTYPRTTTYSSLQQDVFSFVSNQAALASIKNFTAGVYGERRFMLQDLAGYSAAAAMPTTSGNFGFNAGYFGAAGYNEAVLSVAYARHLGEKIDVGVQFNYNSFRISNYGNASAVNFDAGLIIHLTGQLHAGLHAYNPTGSKMGKQGEERLPSIYSAGFGYDASEKFFFGAEVEKVEDLPLNVHAGMQYLFDEKLLARAGVSTSNSIFYFGVGYFLSDFRIDATASVHPQLGLTPGLMLVYYTKK